MHTDTWFCPEMACRADTWIVQRAVTHDDVWNIAQSENDRPFTVAASTPICPCCGTTLQPAIADILEPAGRDRVKIPATELV